MTKAPAQSQNISLQSARCQVVRMRGVEEERAEAVVEEYAGFAGDDAGAEVGDRRSAAQLRKLKAGQRIGDVKLDRCGGVADVG